MAKYSALGQSHLCGNFGCRDLAWILVRREFDDIDSAYGYGEAASTYVIRRADKAVWVVVQSGTSSAALMVVDAPLPAAPAR